jgi:hypothetical protein
MKKKLNLLMIVVVVIMFVWAACDTGAEEDPEPDGDSTDTTGIVNNDTIPPPAGGLDLNELTNDLIIANATKMSGNLPVASNLFDLKIDKDTIFLADGVKTRVRILYPPHVFTGSTFYMQIVGADDYLEVQFEEEEKSDTIAAFYLEFDPEGWELPFSFNIKLVPTDEDGNSGEEITVPVGIEAPANGDCDFLAEDKVWEWIYTVQDGDFYLAPMFPQIVAGTVAGCCDSDNNSYYSDCTSTPSHAVVDYESFFMVRSEYLIFHDDGKVEGELIQQTRNIRPSKSDFCGGVAGYSEEYTANNYEGTFSLNTGNCTIEIATLEGETAPIYTSDGTYLGDLPLPIYAGTSPYAEYQIISRHFIREIRTVEGYLERVYENTDSNIPWYY